MQKDLNSFRDSVLFSLFGLGPNKTLHAHGNTIHTLFP